MTVMVTRTGGAALRIEGITLVVDDMARALGFYRALGFALPRADDSGFATLAQDGGFRLAWNVETIERAFNPEWRCASNGGRMSLVLRCRRPRDVDRIFERAAAAGGTVVLEPFDAPWGARHCRVLDPDGDVVDLFAPIP
jgi:uncharacterized glyoxalase superfamily protein PhnB